MKAAFACTYFHFYFIKTFVLFRMWYFSKTNCYFKKRISNSFCLLFIFCRSFYALSNWKQYFQSKHKGEIILKFFLLNLSRYNSKINKYPSSRRRYFIILWYSIFAITGIAYHWLIFDTILIINKIWRNLANCL